MKHDLQNPDFSKKQQELYDVLDYIKNYKQMTFYHAIFKREFNTQFFEARDFHFYVKENSEMIMRLMPQIVSEGLITKLEKTNDSIDLG